MSTPTIIISAGHSATDCGAVSADRKHKEADLALRLRNQIALNLRMDGGLRVLTDGATSENKPLRDACALVQANPGCIAVELHFNAGPASAQGIEVLAKPKLKRLAQSIAQAINRATGSPLRGELGWKLDSSGQHHRLAFCEVGGAIIEVEFISSTTALAHYLANEARVAENIAAALREAARQ